MERLHQLARSGDARWRAGRDGVVGTALRHRFPGIGGTVASTACSRSGRALKGSAESFLSSLDPDALPPRVWSWLDLEDGDWPGLDGTFGRGAPLARMAGWHPVLGRVFRDAWRDDGVALLHARVALGTHGMVGDVLRRRLGWPGWLTKRLHEAERAYASWARENHALDAEGRPDADRFVAVMGVLARLPASWRPRADQWVRAFEAEHLLVPMSERVPATRLAAFLDVRGDWDGWVARMRAAGPSLEDARADLDDHVDAFVRQVLEPAAALVDGRPEGHVAPDDHGSGRAGAWRLLHGDRVLRTCVEACSEWHAARSAIDAGISLMAVADPVSLMASWAAGLPDLTRDGIHLKVLTTAAELAREGLDGEDEDGLRGLDHCVGGYSGDCAAGHLRVASLRREGDDGRSFRSSTLCVSICDGEFSVQQIRGASNVAADDRDVRFAHDYVIGLNEGRFAVDVAALKGSDAPLTVAARAGYEWWVLGHVEGAMALWGSRLPRRLRVMGAERLVGAWREASTGLDLPTRRDTDLLVG